MTRMKQDLCCSNLFHPATTHQFIIYHPLLAVQDQEEHHVLTFVAITMSNMEAQVESLPNRRAKCYSYIEYTDIGRKNIDYCLSN